MEWFTNDKADSSKVADLRWLATCQAYAQTKLESVTIANVRNFTLDIRHDITQVFRHFLTNFSSSKLSSYVSKIDQEINNLFT